MEGKGEVEDGGEGPPPGWQSIPPPQSQSQPSHAPPKPDVEDEEEGPPPGWRSIPPPPQPQPQPAVHTGMAQMICGSCRRLLSYQQGAKHVQCSCCQIVNLVLEANEVGQVRCGSCAILLMYPYGAPSVRCSSCRFVTDIGEHNRRPPLSVQQGRSPLPANLVH